MVSKAETAKAELDFVRKLARSIAKANGHSHPDDYAEAVVAAHTAGDDAAQEPEAQKE